MSKLFAMVFVIGLTACAHAQVKPQPGMILTPAPQSDPPLIDLGDLVENVVIAKVLWGFTEQELVVAKFGKAYQKDVNATPTRVVKVDVKTEKFKVNGFEDEYPVAWETRVFKKNLTLTDNQRSMPVSKVEAFDLEGKPVDRDVWTKTLQNPKHVLLIREPPSYSAKLNPFYAGLLKEDTLLIFVNYEPPASEDAK